MSSESNSKSSKGRKISINLPELDAIILSTEATLSKEDYRKLRLGFEMLTELLTPPRNNEKSESVFEEDVPDEPSGDKPKPPGHGRKKPDAFGRRKKVNVSHPDLRPGQPCPCGCGGKVYLLKRKLKIRRFSGQPSVELTIFELEQLRCNVCEARYPAPLPEEVGLKTYQPSAVSIFALGRYISGYPFYRQAGMLGCLGVPIAAATQYEVVAAAAKEIRPVHTELIRLAAQGIVAYADDSSVKILNFTRPKEDKRTGIHTTAIVSDSAAFRIGLFFTGAEHCGENMKRLINLREPNLAALIQMTDALSSNFSELESKDAVIVCCCLIHGRRNFVKISKSFPEECRFVLKSIGTVYHNNKHCRVNEFDSEARLLYHQAHSRPVMDKLLEWFNQQKDENLVEPNSGLGKAIQYMLNHWEGLTQFLNVAGAPLDSNDAERAVKKLIMHRKNSLFYKTAKGALTGDIYMSLIYTCQLNGINPFEYLTELQQNVAAVRERPGDWMPWNYEATLQILFPERAIAA